MVPTHAAIRRSKLASSLFKDIAPYILQAGMGAEEVALRTVIGTEACKAAAAEMERREAAKARKRAKTRTEPAATPRKKVSTSNDSFDERGVLTSACGERDGGR